MKQKTKTDGLASINPVSTDSRSLMDDAMRLMSKAVNQYLSANFPDQGKVDLVGIPPIPDLIKTSNRLLRSRKFTEGSKEHWVLKRMPGHLRGIYNQPINKRPEVISQWKVAGRLIILLSSYSRSGGCWPQPLEDEFDEIIKCRKASVDWVPSGVMAPTRVVPRGVTGSLPFNSGEQPGSSPLIGTTKAKGSKKNAPGVLPHKVVGPIGGQPGPRKVKRDKGSLPDRTQLGGARPDNNVRSQDD